MNSQTAQSSSTSTHEALPLALVSQAPTRPPLTHVGLSFLGGLLAISAVGFLSEALSAPLVLGSFGASCVLLFGYPESPFSQPRSMLGGHLVTTTVGVVFANVFGYEWWSMALALATALAAMQLTRTVHPPAGSNPLIVMLSHASWPFILRPTLIGSLIVLAVALAFNNLAPGRSRYPKYWF